MREDDGPRSNHPSNHDTYSFEKAFQEPEEDLPVNIEERLSGYADEAQDPAFVASQLIDLRSRVAERNVGLVQKIQALGGEVGIEFTLGARIEVLVELIAPEGTIEREKYLTAVEMRLGQQFERVVAVLEQPKVWTPAGSVVTDPTLDGLRPTDGDGA